MYHKYSDVCLCKVITFMVHIRIVQTFTFTSMYTYKRSLSSVQASRMKNSAMEFIIEISQRDEVKVKSTL